MCYHISIPEWTAIDYLLDNAVRNDEWEDYFEHLSAFAHAKIPVLTQQDPGKLQAFNWGLIPAWCKDAKQANEMRMMTLNARVETAFEKPSFRDSMQGKRCLIFVNGFYEWRDHQKKKYPYFIRLKNQDAFAMAGLYESWLDKETGEIFNTCSIVTTAANTLMAGIHNSKKRMPVILPKSRMYEWINPALSKEAIAALTKPLPEGLLEAQTISKLITSRTEDSNVSEVKVQFDYPELPPL